MDMQTRAVHILNEPLPGGSQPLSVPIVQSSAFALNWPWLPGHPSYDLAPQDAAERAVPLPWRIRVTA
ncbi:hypothetical protein [Streptomyces sp. NRRL S-481]|uniref:hypothetical protein n=1 Tax=Streptomyces sp. NRRL S-481 TaxID=1463911 RepID=UPI0004C90CBB|nr:hypothetical protein [Streptomyces sp. NRRL S-481]